MYSTTLFMVACIVERIERIQQDTPGSAVDNTPLDELVWHAPCELDHVRQVQIFAECDHLIERVASTHEYTVNVVAAELVPQQFHRAPSVIDPILRPHHTQIRDHVVLASPQALGGSRGRGTKRLRSGALRTTVTRSAAILPRSIATVR